MKKRNGYVGPNNIFNYENNSEFTKLKVIVLMEDLC